MFEHLKDWPKILVTGPQRSGTRIAAKMIAEDTGHRFVEEEDFHTDSLNEFWDWTTSPSKTVIQCPAMCAYVNLLGMQSPDIFVVMMRRNLDDIKASQERIKWGWEFPELVRYFTLDGTAAEVKYQNWDQHQREDIPEQCLDLAYESLSGHPLWVPKEQRARFTPRQTS